MIGNGARRPLRWGPRGRRRLDKAEMRTQRRKALRPQNAHAIGPTFSAARPKATTKAVNAGSASRVPVAAFAPKARDRSQPEHEEEAAPVRAGRSHRGGAAPAQPISISRKPLEMTAAVWTHGPTWEGRQFLPVTII